MRIDRAPSDDRGTLAAIGRRGHNGPVLNEAFERAGSRLTDLVRGSDWSAPLPTCAGKDVGWVVQHLGVLNTWAAAMVSSSAAQPYARDDLDLDIPDDQDGRQAWLEGVIAATADVLDRTPDDAPTWTLAGPGAARFWKRRLLHEVVVHGVDVEIALQLPRAPIADWIADDGIDELLDLLPNAPRPAGMIGSGTAASLSFVAPGAATWQVKWAPPTYTWQRGVEQHADVRVTATLPDLYLYLYGRPARRVEIRGDIGVLDRWRAATRL